MRPSRLLVLLLVSLALAGCIRRGPKYYAPVAAQPAYAAPVGLTTARPYPQQPYVPQPAASQVVYAQPIVYAPVYALDSGDRLRVLVFGQEGLTNSYMVDAAGNLNLALIGPVPARGYSTQDLARAIADRLRSGFIREPHVTVEVEAYRPFYVLGEVTAPGQYPYVANMTVETSVAIAGGYSPRANKTKVQLTRLQNGVPVRSTVPLNFPLKPGDTLTIAERWF